MDLDAGTDLVMALACVMHGELVVISFLLWVDKHMTSRVRERLGLHQRVVE